MGCWILGKVVGGWEDKLVGGQMDKWKYKKWIRFVGGLRWWVDECVAKD